MNDKSMEDLTEILVRQAIGNHLESRVQESLAKSIERSIEKSFNKCFRPKIEVVAALVADKVKNRMIKIIEETPFEIYEKSE